MDFWVYMLRCADDSFYVGHSDDLEKRLAEHEHGFFPDGFTARRLPVRLAFAQTMPTREEAIEREMQLKNWNRKKKEALTQGDWAAVSWWGFTEERRRLLIRIGLAGPSSTGSDRPGAALSPGSQG